MSDPMPCKSHRYHDLVCADGFVQKAICSGRAGCVTCGNIRASSLPHCMSDELPSHYVRDDGAPAFYTAAIRKGVEHA